MIGMIAVIAEKKKSSAIAFFSISAIVNVTAIAAIATIAGKWFPYDRCDH